MFVPLDFVYDYMDDVVPQDLLIYRFFPHGSKNLEHLTPKQSYSLRDCVTRPIMICHDQEPLDWEAYTPNKLTHTPWCQNLPAQFSQWWLSRNLRSACEVNIYDKCILTHSEHHSSEVKKYDQMGFCPVYVWSHAFLARDWFRYAMVDPRLQYASQPTHDFNVYARSWTGTREYRLYFLSLIANIAQHCRVTFAAHDQGIHYHQHQYNRSAFDIQKQDLENVFGNTVISSAASASYSADHYQQCMLDVVLETVFDVDKIYLTEKVLRPIACGKPFLLMGPPGSLEFLRGYGFRTFGQYIDESYDCENNSITRAHAVVHEMQRITRLSGPRKQKLWQQLQSVADYNRQHFFAFNFFDQVDKQYQCNMLGAVREVLQSRRGTEWYSHVNLWNQFPKLHSSPDAAILALREYVSHSLSI